MADGTVTIETKLDNSGAEKGLNDLKKEVESSSKSAAQEIDKASDQAQKSVEEVAKSAEKTGKQVEKSAKDSASKAGQAAKQGADSAAKGTESASRKMQRSHKKVKDTAKESSDSTKKSWEKSNQSTVASTESACSKMAGLTKTMAATVGIGTVVKEVANSGISFESAFTGVTKTVDATSEELSKLRKDIRGMAKEMPESVEEISGVAEAAGQLGIKTKSVAGFTKTMVMLGDATNLSSEEAATSMARFANVTGMSQKNFDKLGSTVVALGNNMATTEKEIVEMATRISGAGSQVGLSEAQIMSFSAALSSVGIEAEAGGTAFSTLLSKMNLATVQGGKSLNSFATVAGMSGEQFKKAFKNDAAGAVLSFINGLDKINKNGGSAIKTLNDMGLSDVRIRDALLRAAGASGTFTEALKIGTKAWNKNTALTKEAETRYKTMESQLQMTKNKLNDIGISVYSSFEKPLVKGVATANKALGNLSRKLENGGIKKIVPEEAINTVENLGKVAMVAGKGGVKVLATSAKALGDNMGVVIPLAASFMGAWAGYKVFNIASKGVVALTTAFNALAAAHKTVNALELIGATNRIALGGGLTTLQTVVGVFTGKISLATAATGAFNAACTAFGSSAGLGVVAVGALAAGVAAYVLTQKKAVTEADRYYSSCTKLKKKQEEMAASIKSLHKQNQKNVDSTRANGVQADQLYQRLTKLMNVEHKSAGTKAQIVSVVKQLNELLPGLNLEYDKEADKLNKSTSAIKKNIEALKEQAMAKAYQKGMESAASKVAKADIENENAIKKKTEATNKYNTAVEKMNRVTAKVNQGKITTSSDEYKKASNDLTKYYDAMMTANKAVEQSGKNLNAAQKELTTYTDKYTAQTNYTEYLKSLDDLAKQAKIKASDIPKSVGEGIKQGVYANPTSGKELKSLIKLDDLVNSDQLAKMQEQGMKIPQYLAQGISDGSVSFKTAATQLGNAINWEDLIQQVKDKGKEVPDSIAQGISSGQYAVPTSIKAVKNLITFEDLKAKALQGGIEVPDYLANGITSGSMKPEEAVKALSNLVSFQDMIDKAGIEGSKVPTELATRVAQGQISVQAAVKQLTDAVGKESEKTAQKTSDAKKKIESNTKLKAPDNSATTNSLKKVAKASNEASSSLKKNQTEIKKASKIPATDNTQSAKTTFGAFPKEAKKASTEVKSSSKTLKSTATKTLAANDGAAKKAGAKLGNDFAKGIASKSGAAKSAGSKVAKAGSSGASSQKSSFVSVGSNLSAGIASGIRSNSGAVSSAAREAVRAAVAAAKAEGKIHSPSRVMESDIGKWMPLGMASGIRKYTSDVEDASGEMANASVVATAKALDIHSPSKVYKDAIGKNIPAGVVRGVKEGQKELNAEMKLSVDEALSAAKSASKKGNYSDIGNNLVSGISEALNTAKSRSSETVQEIIDEQTSKVASKHDKEEQKLQDKIDKLGSKKKNKKAKAKLKKQLKNLKAKNNAEEKKLKIAGEKTAAAYNDAFEKEANRLNKIAQEKLQDLSDEYQTAYNNIKSKMDSLTDKQQSWGNVYDLDQNIMDIEKYQKNLKALENRIPESMMDKILGMDMDQANAYMAWFQNMSEVEQNAYVEKWNKQQSMSKSFSENFYSDDLAKLQANYEKEMNDVTRALQKEMEQAGVNIAKGLTSGMESETRNLNKSMKKICKGIIKTAKDTLKIKSPSREFSKIGSYDIKGAIKGHEKEAPNLYKQMGTISQNMAQKFAKAKLNVQDIQSRMQDAINLQMQTITTRMQPVVQTDSANGSESVVYTGPERIEVPVIVDGREITRVIAPYMDTELSTRATRKSRGGV